MKDEVPLIQRLDVPSRKSAMAALIREAFATVAAELGLTEQNAPTNPAFIRADDLEKSAAENNQAFFGVWQGDDLVGQSPGAFVKGR